MEYNNSYRQKNRIEYRGLMVIVCDYCHKHIVMFHKDNEPKEKFYCKDCNKVTPLTGTPSRVVFNCECGDYVRAVTNSREDHFTFVHRCGYPNEVFYNPTKHRFYGERDNRK